MILLSFSYVKFYERRLKTLLTVWTIHESVYLRRILKLSLFIVDLRDFIENFTELWTFLYPRGKPNGTLLREFPACNVLS